MKLEDSRRLMSVRISPWLVANSLKQGEVLEEIKVEKGVPIDAQLINSYVEYGTNNIVMTFIHPSFDIVEEAYPVPFMNVLFKRVFP